MVLLNDCLSYEGSNVRLASVSALPVLLNEYFATEEMLENNRRIVNNYISELLSESKQPARMGHALALGSLPKYNLEPYFDLILESLIKASKITPNTLKWAEGRRDAIKAISLLVSTMVSELGEG